MGLEAYITGNRVSSYRQGSDRPMGIQSARDSTRASSIIAMDIICHSVNGDSMESVKNYPGDLDDVHFPSSSMYGNVDMNETSELDNNNQAQQSTYLQTIIEVVCGKYQIVHAFSIIKEAEMPCEEISNHKISHEENHLLPYSQDSPKLEALKCLTFMAENLRKQIQSLLVSVHNTPCNVNVGFGLTYENINRLSSSACCFSRILWGLLTSSMDQTDAKDSDEKEKVLMWKSEHASELDNCISFLMELTNIFVNKLLIESNQLSKSSHNTQHFEDPGVKLSLSSTNYLSSKSLVSKANALVIYHDTNKALTMLTWHCHG
ncbi:hypothetical protein JHK87_039534 [Glycine soja]|nr:hypothetical protein JHK87_039534 [Glycine soja]